MATAADPAAQARKAATLFKQIGDPTRLRVLLMLAEGERHVGAISDGVELSQPACSHHICILRLSGLIVCRRQGKNNYYALTAAGAALARVAATVVAPEPK